MAYPLFQMRASKRHRRRKKEAEVVKPKPWAKLEYQHVCQCGCIWRDGYPASDCADCGRSYVLASGLFKESK